MSKVAVIGKDGRTTAIAKSLRASYGIDEVVELATGKDELTLQIVKSARELKPDFVVIGPEEPLADGIVDDLEAAGIPCVGPRKSLARLESSKSFTRELVSKYNIPGNPNYQVFRSLEGIRNFLQRLDGYVIKPDGLTGGKGVKISDAHLFSIDEGIAYCEELFRAGPQPRPVVIEEKLEGEEFSLQSFCDGTTVLDMIPVQDHKRAHEGDTGPNTGGMGSYSCEDHGLPFLSAKDLKEASAINAAVAKALYKETGEPYKGILFGGFMATRDGIRLLEYNARFGDPETLNVLSILKTDFGEICKAIINGTLDRVKIEFERRATVCKYVVPDNYPDHPVKNQKIANIPEDSSQLRTYEAGLDKKDGGSYLTGSRAVAFVGIGKDLNEAEAIAEQAACKVTGPVFHRKDIGTAESISRRVDHMRSLRSRAGRVSIPG